MPCSRSFVLFATLLQGGELPYADPRSSRRATLAPFFECCDYNEAIRIDPVRSACSFRRRATPPALASKPDSLSCSGFGEPPLLDRQTSASIGQYRTSARGTRVPCTSVRTDARSTRVPCASVETAGHTTRVPCAAVETAGHTTRVGGATVSPGS